MHPDGLTNYEHRLCVMECLFRYVQSTGDVSAAMRVVYPFPQLRLTKHFAAWLIAHRDEHTCADRLLAHFRDEVVGPLDEGASTTGS